jgi:hypothetical protein
MATAIPVISLALTAFGAYQSYNQMQNAKSASKDAARNQRASQEAQNRASQVEGQRARIQQVREARIRRAQILSSTGNEGLGFSGTSGYTGGTGAVTSQAGSNIGYINQRQNQANEISAFNVAAGNAMSRANTAGASAQQWQALSGLGMSVFNQSGGFTTIFGGNTFKKA